MFSSFGNLPGQGVLLTPAEQAQLLALAATRERVDPAATVRDLRASAAPAVDVESFRAQSRMLQYARLARLEPAVVEHVSILSLAYQAVSDAEWRPHVPTGLLRAVAREYPETGAPVGLWRWRDGLARCLSFGVPGARGIGVEAAYRYLRAELMLLSFTEAAPEELHEQVTWLEMWRFRYVRPRNASS